jgi:hypothetical protein
MAITKMRFGLLSKRNSLELWLGRPYHLAPFLSFVSNVLGEGGRRAGRHRDAQVVKSSFDLWIGEVRSAGGNRISSMPRGSRASAMLRRSGHASMRCSLCRFDPGLLLTKVYIRPAAPARTLAVTHPLGSSISSKPRLIRAHRRRSEHQRAGSRTRHRLLLSRRRGRSLTAACPRSLTECAESSCTSSIRKPPIVTLGRGRTAELPDDTRGDVRSRWDARR